MEIFSWHQPHSMTRKKICTHFPIVNHRHEQMQFSSFLQIFQQQHIRELELIFHAVKIIVRSRLEFPPLPPPQLEREAEKKSFFDDGKNSVQHVRNFWMKIFSSSTTTKIENGDLFIYLRVYLCLVVTHSSPLQLPLPLSHSLSLSSPTHCISRSHFRLTLLEWTQWTKKCIDRNGAERD